MTTSAPLIGTKTAKVPVLTTRDFSYSPRLFRTIDHVPEGYMTAEPGNADFYDTLIAAVRMTPAELMKSGGYWSPPTEAEEHVVYANESAGATSLINVEALRDYFGNNDKRWHAFGHTLTGLRFRKQDLGKRYPIGQEVPVKIIETDIMPFLSQIADPKFRREDFRSIIEGANKIVGERALQYCRGELIEEIDPVSGLWTRIRKTEGHAEPFALHGWMPLNLNVPKDQISEEYDVAVLRGSLWRVDEHGGCLDVYAVWGRSDAASVVGFRPVARGSTLQEQR